MPSEFDLIARHFTRPPRHAVLGVGDDAALIAVAPGCELAATTDMLVEGVHFFPDVDVAALGHKALAVNLSDLAAMGATPRYAMLSLALPRADESWLARFASGFFALAEAHGVDLIGGDTTRGSLNICIQAMGEVPRGQALRRDGARPGEDVWVSGTLGEAAAAVANRNGRLPLPAEVQAACRARLDRPTPRIEIGVALRGIATAAIDVSDGLLGDLGHICERSGAGATVEFASLPCAAGLQPLRHDEHVIRAMVSGGDDYELCFTAPSARRADIASLAGSLDLPLTRIGHIEPGSGVRLQDAQGRKIDIRDPGFDHFR
jgi:thiamine-monophosphate kinase